MTGATIASPSACAIFPASTLTRTLCLPSAICGPFCSVPPIGTRIVVVPRGNGGAQLRPGQVFEINARRLRRRPAPPRTVVTRNHRTSNPLAIAASPRCRPIAPSSLTAIPGAAQPTLPAPRKPSRPGILAAAKIPLDGKAAISGSNDGRKMATGERTAARSGGVAAAPSATVARQIGRRGRQRSTAESHAAATQKITIASGGMRQRSSSRKPVKAIATSRPVATALSQIGL